MFEKTKNLLLNKKEIANWNIGMCQNLNSPGFFVFYKTLFNREVIPTPTPARNLTNCILNSIHKNNFDLRESFE